MYSLTYMGLHLPETSFISPKLLRISKSHLKLNFQRETLKYDLTTHTQSLGSEGLISGTVSHTLLLACHKL